MKNAQASTGFPEDFDARWRIAIVHSSFYEEEVLTMVESAKQTLLSAGLSDESISVQKVVGCFEIPLTGAALADAGRVDALIGLGIVVQGETHHAEHIVEQAASGMMDVQTRYKVPFAFEILHVDSLEDARRRLEGKGREAAMTVLHSLAQLRSLRF